MQPRPRFPQHPPDNQGQQIRQLLPSLQQHDSVAQQLSQQDVNPQDRPRFSAGGTTGGDTSGLPQNASAQQPPSLPILPSGANGEFCKQMFAHISPKFSPSNFFFWFLIRNAAYSIMYQLLKLKKN